MNVLLLGNGFDLNYHLPTKYINFLNTVQYLSTGPWFDIHTVGDVFGSSKLQKMDKDIAKSYKKYKEAYQRRYLSVSSNYQWRFIHTRNKL